MKARQESLFKRHIERTTTVLNASVIQPITTWIGKQFKLGPRQSQMALVGAVGALLLTLAGLLVFQGPAQSGAQTTYIPEVKTLQIKPRLLEYVLRLPGTVTYRNKAAVASRLPGRVRSVHADQGQRVRKGQVLLQLETFDLKIKLRQAQAAVISAAARRNLTRSKHRAARRDVHKRLKSMERMQADIVTARASFQTARQTLRNKRALHKLGGVSTMDLKGAYTQYVAAMARYYQTRKDYQTGVIGYRTKDLRSAGLKFSARTVGSKQAAITRLNTQVSAGEVKVADAALKSSQLELANVRLMLKETRLVAPISGAIAGRSIEPGEEVKPGEAIFTIVRLDPLLISVSIPERELRHIREKRSVRITIDALGDRVFQGRVYRIAPVIDTKTRAAEVRILIANKDKSIAPGMFARCAITVRSKPQGLAVPRGALLDITGSGQQRSAYVYVIRKNRVFKRKVSLGEDYGPLTEVRKGLKPGEQIVTEGLNVLRDGGRVRIASGADAETQSRANTKTEKRPAAKAGGTK